MGRVVRAVFVCGVVAGSGCAKRSQAPLNAVAPVIGLPPITIDTSRPGLDVREMPLAATVAASEPTVRLSPEVASAMLERRPVRMVYPAEARSRHLEGKVLFRVVIGQTGSVEGLTVLSASDPLFVPVATASVQSWLYRPFVVDGRAIAVDTEIRVDFSLPE